MTICLLKNVDLKWIPLLLDPALVGSVATTSGSSEIGVVGRERESKKGTEREGWWLLLRLCVGGEMLQERQRGCKRPGHGGETGGRRERGAGVKSILCGLRPREYTDEYTDKHERRRG